MKSIKFLLALLSGVSLYMLILISLSMLFSDDKETRIVKCPHALESLKN